MNSFKRSLVLPLSSAILLAGVLVPTLVSAANSSDGRLKVYVEVEDRRSGDYDPSDFTVRVSGDDVSKKSFKGSDDGTTVYVDGWYSVSVSHKNGYTPSYSSGCHGDLDRKDTATCRINIEESYNYNNHNYNYYPQQQYYQQPVVVTRYVGLPNTGFEPTNMLTLTFVLAVIAVAFLFAFPYVRKALVAIVR